MGTRTLAGGGPAPSPANPDDGPLASPAPALVGKTDAEWLIEANSDRTVRHSRGASFSRVESGDVISSSPPWRAVPNAVRACPDTDCAAERGSTEAGPVVEPRITRNVRKCRNIHPTYPFVSVYFAGSPLRLR